MAFITAKQIHDGRKWLPEGTVIEIDAEGTIVSIQNKQTPDTVFYNGILAPGFVNAHCHLELSHMKGTVAEHTGLIPFLKKIPLHRNDCTEEEKKAARHSAYSELIDNGIVAVGDIANTADTLDVRALGQIHFHTFVEALGFTEANASRAFEAALQTYQAFATQPISQKELAQTITPHAPYSVSSSLFKLIDGYAKGGVLTIHNQESEEENKYYTSKQGDVKDLLQALGIDDSYFRPSGRSSLQTYLGWLSSASALIFVHNTYTKREDVQFALNHIDQPFWCLCPNANLYIESKLPDIDMLMGEGANICIGTDSLASNHELSVLSELYTIKKHYPSLPWETLLAWGTYNGAQALQLEKHIGSIGPGKKPGILQIPDIETGIKPSVTRIV